MINKIDEVKNIFGDQIAYGEFWNFSKANLSEEHRIHAITLIASICYQNPKALNSDSLYNRLMAESQGLPSSSFEFVPMLFNYDDLINKLSDENILISDTNMLKYGEKVENGKYLLTNFRAIIYDKEKFGIDLTKHFNTEEECKIIDKHFKVFKAHIDLPTFGQMVRHRVNWQVVSRRYVSGKKMPFEFYVSEKMKNVNAYYDFYDSDINNISLPMGTKDILNLCLNHYYKALEDGVKPEEARRIIPQAAYTTAWCAFQPTQLENFFKLRLDSHAQKEIRLFAKAMKSMVNKYNYVLNMTPEKEIEIKKRLEAIENGTADFLTNEEIECLVNKDDNK